MSSRINGVKNSFPEIELIPKQETNVLEFLTKHPEYDGRDITIGILDSGVDPGSSKAISKLLDGTTAKLISVVDCSGAGDVDVSKEVSATWVSNDNDNYKTGGYWSVPGLSGRDLKLSSGWNFHAFPSDDDNKNGSKHGETTTRVHEGKSSRTVPVVRIGIKRGYELYAPPLKSRIQQERQKILNVEIATYEAEVRKQLAEWNQEHGSASFLDSERIRERDEFQARLDLLSSKEWQEDPGPVYDCVVFYDGQEYRAIVSDQEDLRSKTPLSAFSVAQQYDTLGVLDRLNYAVNFYEHGSILSIVVDSSPHGTHVAGIAAAAEGPNRNGVAPGAKLVSLKIGDIRLGGMETSSALTRALIEAIRHKCDVINMSYGEASAVANAGRFKELSEELVWKHWIEFVSSASNSGPALSTVGTPGGSSSACFGIAAYVSPTMARVLYSMPISENEETGKVTYLGKEEFPGSNYTWSSVGPTLDGDNGVDVTAPGGAIAPVSSWCLQKTRLMNGTSMSSPHACGCVALLMSACKANGIPVSPARLRRAIQNTAQKLPGLSTVEQGAGMIQVDRAWEYLQRNKDNPSEDVHYLVTIDNMVGSPRGVYLRQAYETSVEHSLAVNVEPVWRLEETASEEYQQARIDYETQFQLKSTALDWVSCPEHFVLLSGGRSFKIVVDPSQLPPGLHTAKVIGLDASNPDRGPLFTVPITVAKPLEEKSFEDLGRLVFGPSDVKRYFLIPPLGSTWMDITIHDCRDADKPEASPKLLGLHTVQLIPHAAFRDFEKHENFYIRPAQTVVTSVAVEEAITVELALSRYWSTLGDTEIAVTVRFRGIRPTPNSVTYQSDGAGGMVRVTSDLASEVILPKATLNKFRTPVRPRAGAVVTPLGERDIFPSPDRKIHELVLTYEFTQEEKGSITPRVPALQGVLYESGFESQLLLIFDSDKKLLGSCDAWPSAVAVPKGKCTIRLQIRHDTPSKLEKMKDLTLWLERSMDSISLSVYPTKEALVLGNSTFKKQVLRKGKSTSLFLDEPPTSKLPSSCRAGDILEGSFTIGAGDESLPGSGKRPGGFPLRFVVGPKADKPLSDPEPPEPEDKRTPEERMEEAVRDLKVAQLSKMSQKEKEDGKFDELYAALSSEYPDHLPLLMARLKYLDSHANRLEMLERIVSCAKAVIGLISENELALHFGKKSDSDDPEAAKERKEMKDKKSNLCEALARLALAYASMPRETAADAQFTDTLKKLKEWTDIDSSDKYVQLVMEREERAGRLGTLLKVVNKLLAKGEIKEKDYFLPISKSSLYEKRVELLRLLGFSALVEHDKMTRVVSCPSSYTLF